MSEPYCSRCRFWRRGDDPERGQCRRHAPLATGGLHTPIETVWPETMEADCCGDFEGDREAWVRKNYGPEAQP